MSLIIATWNVQWQFGDWEERQPAILETLRAVSADIITLQETWTGQVDEIATALGYEATWAGYQSGDDERDGRAMGNAVLSRLPMIDTSHRFLAELDGREYRTVVGACVETPQGTLPVFTTHLNHRFDQSETRMAQLAVASEFVEEHAADLPPILTGDLNAVPDSDEIRKLTGRSQPYVDGRVWADAWEQVGQGLGHTWSLDNEYINNSAWPNRRLDYVLIGWPRPRRPIGNPQRAWLIGTEPIAGVTASDHYGVAVQISTGD